MAIALLGINHASAPVQLRERVAFDPAHLAASLKSLCALPEVQEALILSTCNRTEVYVAHNQRHNQRHNQGHNQNQNQESQEQEPLKTKIINWLQSTHALDEVTREDIENSLYFKQEQECLRHILAVSCGLDSMVIGEPQIFGQVKSAYQNANVYGTVKQELDNVFQFVFRTAKRIRTDTKIGNHAVSLASAGVQLGHKIFSDFNKHTAILIGAGETIELVAQHLHQHGLRRMVFANRSVENANKLAHKFQAYSISLDDLGAHLAEADMLFTSTASPDPILYSEHFVEALKQRKRKPMFVVDLAVPRDIDAAVKDLDNVYLYSIDDLQQIIAGNQQARLDEAEKAQEIVSLALNEFEQAKSIRTASPAIRELRQHFEQQRDALLGTALEKLNSNNAEQVLTQFAHQLTNRFLHQPTRELRASISKNESHKVQQLLQLLVATNNADPEE